MTIERRPAPPWLLALPAAARPPRALDGVVPDAQPGRYRNERDGSLLAWVPPGEVRVVGAAGVERSSLERGVLLGLHEVTNAQVRRFRAEWRQLPDEAAPLLLQDELAAALDWFDAHAYCRWAGLRLPRDVEWLRAATGDEARRYPWGDGPPARGQVAALGSVDDGMPEAVLGRPGDLGPFGHLGLGGNDREWVQERLRPDAGEGPGQAERIVRGASATERFETAELARRRGVTPTPAYDMNAPETIADRALLGLRVAVGPDDPRGAPRDLGWTVRAARSGDSPPADSAALDALLRDDPLRVEATLPHLDLRMGVYGPGHALRAADGSAIDPKFPVDRFVIVARARPTLPAGRWLVVTHSDDAIRVRVNGAQLIDAWTGHGDRVETAAFDLAAEAVVDVRVDYFELRSNAVLSVDIVPD